MRQISDNARRAYGLLRKKGYQHHVAAGLVGNMMQESGWDINTGAVGDNGNAFGAVQWNGPRRRAFLDYAQQVGADPTDLRVQVDFLDRELRTSERGAAKAIMAAPDLRGATLAASSKFWRPGDPRDENRLRYANAVASQIGGGGGAGTLMGGEGSDYFMAGRPGKEAAPAEAQESASPYFMAGKPRRDEPEKEAPQPEKQSAFAGYLDSLTQGLTLGQGRKLTALENALLGGTDEESFWQEYDRFLAAENAQQAQFREERPLSSAAVEIAGAVAPALITGGATAPASAAATGARTAPLMARAAGAILRSTPAGIAARVGSGGMGRAVLAGAGAGAVYGESEAEQGGLVDRGLSALQGAGMGAVGGAVGHQLGKLFSRIVSRPQYFDGHRITEQGKQALRNVGIDPAEVSDDFARAWAARIQQAGGATDEAARLAQADEFGIPLTRGQATGREAQIAFENAARNNARGQMAKAAVDSVDDTARARVAGATDDIAQGLGGTSDDALAAAERVTAGVKAAEQAARSGYKAAYKAADDVGAWFEPQAVSSLPGRALDALEATTVSPTPAAADAVRALEKFTTGLQSRDGVVQVQFQAIETLRQRIGNSYGNDPAANRQVRAVIGALDDWTADLMESALYSGDPAALGLVKNARGLFKSYVQTFTRQSGDDASAIIEKMAKKDVTPTEVANWLYGASNIGAKGASVRTAKRLQKILPPEAWDEVRSGAWLRVAKAPEGRSFGPQAMASRIAAFVDGEGEALAKVLYTPQERATMRRFGEALKLLVPPKTTTNPSGTGYEVARLGQHMMQALASTLGFAAGGPAGGMGTMLMTGLGKNVPDAVRAMRVPATAATRLPSAAGATGAVAGGSGAAILETRD